MSALPVILLAYGDSLGGLSIEPYRYSSVVLVVSSRRGYSPRLHLQKRKLPPPLQSDNTLFFLLSGGNKSYGGDLYLGVAELLRGLRRTNIKSRYRRLVSIVRSGAVSPESAVLYLLVRETVWLPAPDCTSPSCTLKPYYYFASSMLQRHTPPLAVSTTQTHSFLKTVVSRRRHRAYFREKFREWGDPAQTVFEVGVRLLRERGYITTDTLNTGIRIEEQEELLKRRLQEAKRMGSELKELAGALAQINSEVERLRGEL